MRTVLLVLQSEEFRLALQNALSDHYDIFSAKNPVEGAALLDQRPDALLLDLFLPGTDGFSFLQENRRKLPPAVLLFTTLNNSSILQTAADLGVSTVLLKPCALSSVQKWLEVQL